MAAGGEVIGIIPQALVDAEVAHRGLTELHVVPGMHERKKAFTDLSDGFVTIAAHADSHYPILCRLIGKPEMGTDPRLATCWG